MCSSNNTKSESLSDCNIGSSAGFSDTNQAPLPGGNLVDSLRAKYLAVRGMTEALCTPLCPEDYVVQSTPSASPTKWHIAHTTWFFETLVLDSQIVGYKPVNLAYRHMFNSYYNTIGQPFMRGQRGVLSRPTVGEIFDYRRAVDASMVKLIERCGLKDAALRQMIETGLHHEQQHQELMLTDLKHMFSENPLKPVYVANRQEISPEIATLCRWNPVSGGIHLIGHDGLGFAYDNESPRHEVLVKDFQLASHLVTNAEYLAFIDDGGYSRHELWLADGWEAVKTEGWQAPLYWHCEDGQWRYMTLSGLRDVVAHEPVCHISYFEADAFARWSQSRLPTEAEWEIAATGQRCDGNFLESRMYHPRAGQDAAPQDDSTQHFYQMYGDVWEWTASAYLAYPGFKPAPGALGEYNGKFMCNQFVLRGGSCMTPRDHIRQTYRNFFPPIARWQFAGLRLARDV